MRDGLRHPGHAVFVCAVALIGASCRDDVRWTKSDGDVAVGHRMLDYEVTSARYRRWIAAHRALDGVEIGEPVSVDLRDLTESDIDRVQKTLESHAAARASIESVGMTVRDFVLTTIALAQPWAESNRAVSATVDIADPGPAAPRVVDSPQRLHVRVQEDDSDGDDGDDDEDDEGRKKKRKKKGRG